jgi:hypothetical protein
MKHETIYVYLLEEGTDVWRPVEAEVLARDRYRIISENINPKDEKWEFVTGDIVRCKRKVLRNSGTQVCLVAVSKE